MNKNANSIFIITIGSVVLLTLLFCVSIVRKSNEQSHSFLENIIPSIKKTENKNTSDTEQAQTKAEPVASVSGKLTLDKPNFSAKQKELANIFYKNSVFIGDSITAGYETHASGADSPEFLENITFLDAVSYTILDATYYDGGAVDPIYLGKATPALEALNEISPKRVFIDLGLNELTAFSPQTVANRYRVLINNIKLVCPDTEIYIISNTYMVKDSEKDSFNNEKVAQFNSIMNAGATDYTFLNLADELSVDGISLAKEYSSDGYVHFNSYGYNIWDRFFVGTAVKFYDSEKEDRLTLTTEHRAKKELSELPFDEVSAEDM